MIHDIEINENELKELCKHYLLPCPKVIVQNPLYTRIDIDQDPDTDYLHYLNRDNIAIYDEGELL